MGGNKDLFSHNTCDWTFTVCFQGIFSLFLGRKVVKRLPNHRCSLSLLLLAKKEREGWPATVNSVCWACRCQWQTLCASSSRKKGIATNCVNSEACWTLAGVCGENTCRKNRSSPTSRLSFQIKKVWQKIFFALAGNKDRWHQPWGLIGTSTSRRIEI